MRKCVGFNLDGLLVDSEAIQFNTCRLAFVRFSFELASDICHQWDTQEAPAAYTGARELLD